MIALVPLAVRRMNLIIDRAPIPVGNRLREPPQVDYYVLVVRRLAPGPAEAAGSIRRK